MSGRVDKGKAKVLAAASRDQDVKWRERYYDLKKQTLEIEADNDKLHLEVLKTRKKIQRVRIERAILLERLAAMRDLPREPLPRTYDIARGSPMDEDLAPTAAALQGLVRESVASGLHRQSQTTPPNSLALIRSDTKGDVLSEQESRPLIQPYQALPPPEMPEVTRPTGQPRQEALPSSTQQPLPLPQPQISASPVLVRAPWPQVAFGPPAPNRAG